MRVRDGVGDGDGCGGAAVVTGTEAGLLAGRDGVGDAVGVGLPVCAVDGDGDEGWAGVAVRAGCAAAAGRAGGAGAAAPFIVTASAAPAAITTTALRPTAAIAHRACLGS